MGQVVLDAFLDSLKLLAVVAVFTYIIAFIEPKLSEKVTLKGKFAPLVGVSISLLPQCGFSVVATDLYKKRHITLGTLIGVYLATSDEALPIFLTYPQKALHILPLLALKFVLGLAFAYLIDFIFKRSRISVYDHLDKCDHHYKIKLMHNNGAEKVNDAQDDFAQSAQVGILDEYSQKYQKKLKTNQAVKRFFVKPLLHSLEIFAYVFVVNIIFGIIIYYVGSDKIAEFLLQNKYVAPLFSVLVGAIPNCASSIVISRLYIFGGIGFGAALGGLCMNAGVAFTVLFKDIKNIKLNFAVFAIMFVISVAVSYIFSLIFSFDVLKF